jgi:hypothetical protein
LSLVLPIDIVNHILSYDSRFTIRRGVAVNSIDKTDFRYSVLSKIRPKSFVHDPETNITYGFVYLPITKPSIPSYSSSTLFVDRDYCICYYSIHDEIIRETEILCYDENGNAF